MTNQSKLKSLAFTTTRIDVSNVDSLLELESSRAELLSSIVSILSPSVVKSLPPYFFDIESESQADIWLNKMVSESHLFTVNLKKSKSVIGFVFLYESDNATAHIGYLLGECFWHQGYGSELLLGLIECCRSGQLIDKLIGGVDIDNVTSAKLLEKVGFVLSQKDDSGVNFYEYIVY